MKHLFIFYLLCLVEVQGLKAQCASARTITWDGGGRDELWHNPLNWSIDSVPDCNDVVLFNRAVSTKTCRITASVQCGSIVLKSGAGRVVVGAHVQLKMDSLLNYGAIFMSAPLSGAFEVKRIYVANNGFCSVAGVNCSGTITIGNGVFTVCAGNSIKCNNLEILKYAMFKAPEAPQGVLRILGDFYRHPQSTFDHRYGILRFEGSNPLRLYLNNKPLVGNVIEFAKTGSALNQPGNALSSSKDTIIALQRMTFYEVTFRDQSGSTWNAEDVLMVRDTMEFSASMGDNTGTFGFHSGSGTLAPLTLAFTGSGNSCLIQNQSGGIVGRHRLLVDKANPLNEVRLLGLQLLGTPSGTIYERIRIERGRLMFRDSVNALIRVVTGTSDKSTVGLYVGRQGALCAPDGDTLDFFGTWELRDSLGWQMKRGTFRLQSAGVCFSNGNTLRFHHLDMAARTSSLNLSDGSAHIAGNLVLSSSSTSSSNGTVRGGTLFLEGNYTSLRTSGSNPTGNPLCFVGSGNQLVKNPLPGELARGIVMQKSGGTVTLNDSAAPLSRLEFKGGVLISAKMLQTSSGQLTGGSAGSFLHGRLMLLNSGNDNLNILFPIGKGSQYRPLRITHSASIGSSRTWVAEYFQANPLNSPRGSCLSKPLDSLSSSGYWFVNNNYESSSTRYHLGEAGISYGLGTARMARWDSLQKCWVNKSSSGPSAGWLSSSGTLGTARTTGYHYLAVAKVSASVPPENNDHEISLVPEVDPSKGWSVFPNPVCDWIQVRCPVAGSVWLEIKDIKGRLMHHCSVYNGARVDLSFLKPGLYHYTLGSTQIQFIGNLVKL